MSMVNLNLARKWRSQSFDQLVGQELCVRMLKNSLYLNQYFPVYLFSGQRGCGKTSTARIFAAAVNCSGLTEFQKNPKATLVPCLQCASCQAMLAGKHPDFFEIDAASHTGVDHIRQIIESSLLLPLMGGKKIYLIDEAHMLSKASFNALLKILEEPPHSVLFILATTDAQKIIDTVKSRCFQLIFKPIDASLLGQHLQSICSAENISWDAKGLDLIVQESEGSARDALNMLEQVRYAGGDVTYQTVLRVLGHLPHDQVVNLMRVALTQSPTALLQYVQDLSLAKYSAEFIWRQLQELARTATWMKHGVMPTAFHEYGPALKELVDRVPWKVISSFMEYLHTQEMLFTKTTAKHEFLEMVLLQICYNNSDNESNGGVSQMPQTSAAVADDIVHDDGVVSEDEDDDEEDEDEEEDDIDDQAHTQLWQLFVHSIETLQDPLLTSIFKQAQVKSYDQDAGVLTVTYAQNFAFFNDWLADTKALWMPHVQKVFGQSILFKYEFSQPAVPVQAAVVDPVVQPRTHPAAAEKKNYSSSWNSKKITAPSAKEHGIDSADAHTWPQAHMVLRHFPGTITEIREAA